MINLDPSNSSIRDHLYNVLTDLNKKILSHLQINQKDPMLDSFQQLYRASYNLLHRIAQERAGSMRPTASPSIK